MCEGLPLAEQHRFRAAILRHWLMCLLDRGKCFLTGKPHES